MAMLTDPNTDMTPAAKTLADTVCRLHGVPMDILKIIWIQGMRQGAVLLANEVKARQAAAKNGEAA
jgi:hypothetical protein